MAEDLSMSPVGTPGKISRRWIWMVLRSLSLIRAKELRKRLIFVLEIHLG